MLRKINARYFSVRPRHSAERKRFQIILISCRIRDACDWTVTLLISLSEALRREIARLAVDSGAKIAISDKQIYFSECEWTPDETYPSIHRLGLWRRAAPWRRLCL
jgi:hypothetical protein